MEGKDDKDKDNDKGKDDKDKDFDKDGEDNDKGKDDKDDLISVPHEPRLDHSIERGLKDPEELLLCHGNLASLWYLLLAVAIIIVIMLKMKNVTERFVLLLRRQKTSGVSCTDPGASSPRSPFVAALELRGCDNCDVRWWCLWVFKDDDNRDMDKNDKIRSFWKLSM